MTRVTLRQFVGKSGKTLKIARLIAKKIQGTQRLGRCVLIDCEEVDLDEEFLAALVSVALPDKIRFCGLPLKQQQFVASLERKHS
jgi:hypothetical protein